MQVSTSEKGNLLLSLGSINADFQVRVERRPEISETLIGRDFKRFGGGKAANVACCARRLGVNACLFGHVGDDDLAEQALTPLRQQGVDVSHVARVKGTATGVAMITVPPDGNKGIVLATNANEVWTDEDADELAGVIGGMPAKAILAADCEVPASVVARAVAAAKRRGCQVVLDPSPAERVDDRLIAAADVITPNPAEAKQLLGFECDDVGSAAQGGAALVKRGAGLVEKTRTTHIGTVPVDVVDTTGAGDAFAGTLATALLKGCSQPDATRYAVAAAHLTVTAYGSQPALPSWPEAEQMARRLPVSSLAE